MSSTHRPLLLAFPPQVRTEERDRRARQGLAVMALAVALGYLAWRALFTLNPDALVLSWFLWSLEAHAVLGIGLTAFSLWDPRPVVPVSSRVPEGRTAVLVTTYNEPTEIVLPTVAAATRLRGDVEVWLLDDGVRPEMQRLAERLGANYLAREDSTHAKAGNLNNALAQIDAEFVAVLDADHVPSPHFLARTLPYFNDERLAVVQTPQDFYNEDSFEHVPTRRRSRRRAAFTEQSLFYRVIQPGKNRWGAAFWCGTPAVLRTAALRDVGGVATDSVTEDLMTTIRLHRAGWRTVFHDEVLARGLAAPTAEEYQLQRRRWGIGAIQTLRHERPITGPGLDWRQRIAYAATFLAWFDSVRLVGLLLVPVLVLFSGAAPLATPLVAFLVVFGAYFSLQAVAMVALGRGHLRPIRSATFELVRLESVLTAIVVGATGTDLRFEVTPKGRSEARRIPVSRLLLGFLVLHVGAAAWYLATVLGFTGVEYAVPGVAHGAAVWLAVNLALLLLAVGRIRSQAFGPERRRSHRHELRTSARLDGRPATLTDLSLTGARVELSAADLPHEPGAPVHLEVDRGVRGEASLAASVVATTGSADGVPTVRVDFDEGQYEQRARAASGLAIDDDAVGAGTPETRAAAGPVEAEFVSA